MMVLQDSSVEGELTLRNFVEPGKILFNFSPRGQMIEVLDGATVIHETLFPSSYHAGQTTLSCQGVQKRAHCAPFFLTIICLALGW